MWFVVLEVSESILYPFAVFLYAFCVSCLRLYFSVAWPGPSGWVLYGSLDDSELDSSEEEFIASHPWGDIDTFDGLVLGALPGVLGLGLLGEPLAGVFDVTVLITFSWIGFDRYSFIISCRKTSMLASAFSCCSLD
jgi:hypothetical protein